MTFGRLTVPVLIAGALLMGLWLIGCEGDQGPAGPPGANAPAPPIITAIVAAPDSVGTGQTAVILVSAYDPNGDAMTYAWTATGGSIADATAAATVWTAPAEMGLYRLKVVVSDGITGSDADSIVVGVNVYVPAVYPSYAGDDQQRCGHCHSGLSTAWDSSGHALAYATLVAANSANNPYCLQCHTTGYDTRVDYGGSITQPGVNNGGYDDNPDPSLENVQCEQCHGPMGPVRGDHRPDLWAGLTGEACERCHEQYTGWTESGHGSVLNQMTRAQFYAEWSGASCEYCHIQEGFLKRWDPAWASRTYNAATANMVGCATCHDEHGNSNVAQLRTADTAYSPYGGPSDPNGYVISGLGAGQQCAHCHHARRTQTQIMSQINDGSAHPGPHLSLQADMIKGKACYEIPGLTYEHTSQHTSVPDACVRCHMELQPIQGSESYRHSHEFAPSTATCANGEGETGCHSVVPSNFDISGVQTEIHELLEQLAALLPHDSAGNVPEGTDTLTWTRLQREADYAYLFVEQDASLGVHNYDYARSLLQNAIDTLTAAQAAMADRRVRLPR
jgi:hypothetical protein